MPGMNGAEVDAVVRDGATLRALYGAVGEASRVKEVDHIHPAYAAFITTAPFLVLATAGPNGLDASPRGDRDGLVTILDPHTLLLPDRRGNNRIDSLENILVDPRIGLLFLLPGVGETLRVNGRAEILVTPDLLDRFIVDGKRPRSVLRIRVDSVFFQCSRAVARARLWDPAAQIERTSLPSPGDILAMLSRERIDGAAYDRDLPERLRTTLY